MTRKRSVWLLGAFILALAVSGTLYVQAQGKDDDEKREEVRSFAFSSIGGRARLGVGISDVTAEKARELKLPGEYGALVTEVAEESPAAKAGVQVDDVIIEFDGERVRSANQLVRLVRETPAGRSITLQVSRGGQTRSLTVALEERHARFFRVPSISIPDIDVRVRPDLHVFTRRPRLGITADDLTSQLADYFGVEQGEGVLVREVLAGSAAEKGGLKAGDVIVQVDETGVASVSELRRALTEATRDKKEVTLTIVRDRKEQALNVEIERPERRLPPPQRGDHRPRARTGGVGRRNSGLRRRGAAVRRGVATGVAGRMAGAERAVGTAVAPVRARLAAPVEGAPARAEAKTAGAASSARAAGGENRSAGSLAAPIPGAEPSPAPGEPAGARALVYR